jgi:DNA-binding MarR family transcriptional regulator
LEIHTTPAHLIRRLHQIATQVFTQRCQAAGFDLTPVQYAAMQALLAKPGIDQAQIAALIAYDRATIGGVIDRLQQKGYVTRVISQRDRRAREVRLTEAGIDTLTGLTPQIRAAQDEILGLLSPEERSTFTALARKAVGGLAENDAPGAA